MNTKPLALDGLDESQVLSLCAGLQLNANRLAATLSAAGKAPPAGPTLAEDNPIGNAQALAGYCDQLAVLAGQESPVPSLVARERNLQSQLTARRAPEPPKDEGRKLTATERCLRAKGFDSYAKLAAARAEWTTPQPKGFGPDTATARAIEARKKRGLPVPTAPWTWPDK
jgi:hypothetical protein